MPEGSNESENNEFDDSSDDLNVRESEEFMVQELNNNLDSCAYSINERTKSKLKVKTSKTETVQSNVENSNSKYTIFKTADGERAIKLYTGEEDLIKAPKTRKILPWQCFT